MGQFKSDDMGQAKSESIDQCDRILQAINDAIAIISLVYISKKSCISWEEAYFGI